MKRPSSHGTAKAGPEAKDGPKGETKVAPKAEPRRPPSLIADNTGLVAVNIGKSFKRRPVLRGVTLSLQRGEAIGLLGPNGAGKTTCFYIMTGLLSPDYGWITLDGHDITDLPMYRRARLGIGYLPQEASIFRGLTVEQNVRSVLEVVESDRDRREAMLDELLAEFSASGAGSRSPARSPRTPTSCCWTNPWPASIRSRSTTSATWSRTSRTGASAY